MIVYTESDAALGQRIQEDLAYYDGELPLIVVLSEAGKADPIVQQAIIDALDAHQHIIPVLASPGVRLPKLIDNLQPLDFSERYSTGALLKQVEATASAPAPLTALTPRKRKANQRVALIMVAVVGVIFVATLILVGGGTIRAPDNEFASVETQIYLTRNYFIDSALPLSTEDATGFAATVEEVPTRARVQLIATATAIAAGVDGTFVPRSTQEATNFPATLRAVSTVVQDRLAGSATAAAANSN